MKILQINKFLYPRGGADVYMLALSKLLEANGHEVIHFAMQHPHNPPSKWSKYFVSEIDFGNRRTVLRASEGQSSAHRTLSAFGRMLWSCEAARKIEALIKAAKPDVAHIHNIYHQISPSILPVLRRYKIPVVMTAHDYHLISPNYLLFPGSQSAAQRFAGAIEHAFHKALGVWERNINRIICPSKCMYDELLAHGIPKQKLILIPNFVTPWTHEPNHESKTAEGVLYFGRISEEKGIRTLIDVAGRLPAIPFKIIGDGPMAKWVRAEIRAQGLQNVECEGPKYGRALQEEIARARIVVLPSLWPENAPLSVLEAMATGKPVVASRIGGIPEIVRDGKTGVLTPPDDARMLAETLRRLYQDADRLREYGEAGRKIVEKEYSQDLHYRRVCEAYQAVTSWSPRS